VWNHVRRLVDERQQPGQFILTGSATPRDDVLRHSGAGRISVLRLRTMTLFEQAHSDGAISLQALLDGAEPVPARILLDLAGYAERIVVGGWPQLLGADVGTAMRFTRDYLDTIIEHDIDTVSGGRRDPRLVRRFLHAYAQLTAHPARLATIIARARGETDPDESDAPSRWTAQPYLDALRRMMVIDEIPAWDPGLRSRARLIGVDKRLLGDPSLAASLLDCSPPRLLGKLNTLGLLFEALVARDLRVYAEHVGGTVFHFREQSGRLEVDLVVERTDGRWAAFEVKLGGGAVDQAAATLLRMADKVAAPPAALAVVTAGEYGYRRPDGVWVIPLGCLGP
jgi:uncharacterized protein